MSAFDILNGYKDRPGLNIAGINPAFAERLAKFVEENPYGVGISSAFRSPEQQASLFSNAVAKYGSEDAARKWVAPPGRSNHNHGDAADLSWEDSDAKKWAHDNAERYGLKFPLNNENWHVEPAETRGGATPPGGLSLASAAPTPPVNPDATVSAPATAAPATAVPASTAPTLFGVSLANPVSDALKDAGLGDAKSGASTGIDALMQGMKGPDMSKVQVPQMNLGSAAQIAPAAVADAASKRQQALMALTGMMNKAKGMMG